MSKSQWLPDDKQTGNFSNDKQDTFDPGKGYVGIRLQQGVPLLDRDWNELEDIRRYAEVMLRRHYVGDGTPDDGFRISALDEPGNDFKISIGRCLVDGFEVVNAPVVENGDEIEYILYSQQEDFVQLNGTTDDPRTDIVYLDVWIEEIKSANEEDPLKNPQDVDMETCIRHKVEWRVRVKEGNTGDQGEEKHYYYKIAKINRPVDTATISEDMIEDLRKTNLAVYQLKAIIDSLTINIDEHNHSKLVSPDGATDPALMVKNNGNVGIGTDDPQDKLDVHGALVFNGNVNTMLYGDERGKNNSESAVVIKGDFDELEVKGRVIEWTGTNLYIGSENDHSHDFIAIGQNVGNIRFLSKIGEDNVETMRITDGKVGIGALSPKNKLDVRGGTVIGSGYSGTNTAPENGLLVEGNVGIGTTTPKNILDVAGGVVIGSHYAGSKNAPTDGLVVEGNMEIGGHPGFEFRQRGGDHVIEDADISLRRANLHRWLIQEKEGSGFRIFQVFDNDGTAHNRVVFQISYNGNVGIGTDEPKGKLDVHGALVFNGNEEMRVYGASRSNRNTVVIGGEWQELEVKGRVIDWTGSNFHIGFYNEHPNDYIEIGRKVGNIRFLSGGGNVETMRITDGKVGIGTDEPDFKLHIKSDGTVGHFESTADTAVLRLVTSEGINNHISFINRPGGRAAIFVVGGGDAFNVLKNGNIGIGTDNPTHTLQVNGDLHVRNWKTVGSDYSEYFESKNGKTIPAGTAVVMENGKVRRANKNDTPIGIISANPGMAGGIHVEWPKKYLKDEFGNQIMEEYKEEIMIPKKEKIKKERQKTKKKKIKEKVKHTEIVQKKGKYCQVEIEETIEREEEEPIFKEVDLYDASGKKKIGKHQVPVMETYEEEIEVLDDKEQPVLIGSGKFETKTRPKINPEYDETKEYIPREKRPEWNCVGLLGQLPLRKGQPVAPTWVKIKNISKDVELWLVR